MRRILVALFALIAIPAHAQQWDRVNGSMQVRSGPANPLVIIDQTNTSTNNKILSLRANGTEKCSVDVDGDLVCAGSFSFTNVTFTGQAIGPLDTDCSAPAYSGLGKLTTGFAVRTAPSAAICVNGTLILLSTASSVASAVPITVGATPATSGSGIRLTNANGIHARSVNNDANYTLIELDASNNINIGPGNGITPLFLTTGSVRFPNAGSLGTSGERIAAVYANTYQVGADVSLTTGAANRLDLASGDSFQVVSGNVNIVSGEFQSAGNRINYNLSAYGVGTAYVLTNSAAAIDFGTTDPAIVLDKAGTYQLCGQVNLAYNAATVAAETATIKVRRTNNTAADLSPVVVLDLPVATTLTHTYGIFPIPCVFYTTAATDDAITLFANVSAALGAGSIDATAIGTAITAVRLY